jgi:hypothetical protein
VLGNGCFLAGLCDRRFHYFAQVHGSSLQGNAARPRVLSLDGCRVDAIQVVSKVMTFGFVDEIPVEQIWFQLFPYPMVCRPDHLCRTGESLDLEFCKTLLASPLGASAISISQVQFGRPSLLNSSNPKETLTRQAQCDVAHFLISLAQRHDAEMTAYLSLLPDTDQGSPERLM